MNIDLDVLKCSDFDFSKKNTPLNVISLVKFVCEIDFIRK